MLKKTLVTAFLFFTMPAATYAQDINGKWVGKIMDQFEVAYTFKADGETLTGSTTGPDGNEILVKEGKIKANDVEFSINIMDNDTKIIGRLDGETLKLKFTVMGNDVELVLKKETK